MTRADGRSPASLRSIRLVRSCLRQAAGSALIRAGNTQVLCAATIDEKPPPFLRGTGRGWITAEYGMLPGSVTERAARNRPTGRGMEIQRLIGRSLRSVVDLTKLGERTVMLDCDVLDADGGTRTAAVTAAYVALCEAIESLERNGKVKGTPVIDSVAAVSVGRVSGEYWLDLCHEEDARADVDLNLVVTGSGQLVEVQGTAEHGTYTPDELQRMIRLGLRGVRRLTHLQRRCLELAPRPHGVLLRGRTEEREDV